MPPPELKDNVTPEETIKTPPPICTQTNTKNGLKQPIKKSTHQRADTKPPTKDPPPYHLLNPNLNEKLDTKIKKVSMTQTPTENGGQPHNYPLNHILNPPRIPPPTDI